MSVVLGSAAVQLVADDSQFRSGLHAAEKEAQSFASRVSGSLARIGEIAAGTLIGNVLPRLTSGFAGLAKEGLGAVADYERLGMSLESLVAKELRQQSVVKETISLGQRRVELTAEEKDKLQDLTLQRGLMTAKLQEESERHRQLVAQWGEEGLAVKTHAAQMAIMQGKYEDVSGAIATLEGKQGKMVNVTQTNTKMTLSMADALDQAGPKAKELIRWIELLAVKSPFQQEDVASAFRMAQAYGFVSDSADKNVVSAKRLTTALIDFTSATGATGPTMERISMALGQIQAKGKLAGQEVLQLTQAGLAVDQILAQAFGKSTAQIVDMREKGLIPADQAILAIVQSLETDFGGAAARSAGTFSGLISTLSDIKTIGLREFFTGAFEAAKPLLDGLATTLSSEAFITKLNEMGTALGGFITTLIAKAQELVTAFQTGGFGGVLAALGISPEISTLLTNVGAGLSSLGQIVTGTVLPALSSLAGQVMPAISTALAFVNQHWEAFKGALMGVAAVLAGAAVVGAIAGLAGTLAALVNPVTLLIGLAAALGAAWATNFGGIQTKAAEVWAVVGPIFDQFKAAIEAAVATFTSLRGEGEGVFGALGGAVETFAAKFGVLEEVKGFITGLQETWALLVEFFEPTIERLKESFGQMITSFEPIGGKLEELWQAAEPVLSTLAEVIGVVVVGAVNLLMEVVAAVMPSVGGIIGNAIDAATVAFQFIGTVIQEVVTLVKAIFEGDWATVWQSAGAIVSAFGETIKTLLGLIWDSFSTIFTDLVEAIGNWIGNIDAEAGKRFQAFVDGVAEKFTDVYGKVKKGLDTAVDYIRKIDLAEIGRNLITSLANALWSRATSYLREKAQGIASLLPDWVKRMLGIASPSRVFYEIGLNIIAGLVEGMEYRTPEALEAMASVLGSIGDILEGMFELGSATVVVDGWADKLRGLTQQMQELYVIFNEFAAWSFNNGNVMEALADVGSQMSSVTGGIIDTIEAMAELGAWKAVDDVPGKLRSLMDAIRQTVIALAGLADQQGIEEAASISHPLVIAAQAIADIATAWTKVGTFVQGTLDVEAVTAWLAGFANMAVSALVAAQGNATALPEKFAEFVAGLRTAVTFIADLAKAWETVAAFKWQDKDWSVSAVLDFLTAFGGLATQFVTSLSTWTGFKVDEKVVAQVKSAAGLIADLAGAWADVQTFKWSPTEFNVTGVQEFLVAFGGFAARFVTALNSWAGIDVKAAVVTQVRTAVGLLADIAGAWERVQTFKFLPKDVSVTAIQEWLVAFGGFAARFVTALSSWQGIKVDDKVVAQVRAAVQLIADIAGAWERVQTFKAKPQGMDVGKVVSWLASFGGQVTVALAEVSKWKQFKGLGEEFQRFLDNFKATMAAASEALKFANELGAWKEAKDLPDRFLRLRNDFEQIIIYVVQMRAHVGDMVTSDLVKFVRYVGELSDGLISAVKLMAELENLRRFDIVGAVDLLASMINQFLDGLETIIEGLTERQAELTEAFGAALASLMQGLQAALELALAAPDEWGAPDAATWSSFLTWVTGIFDWFRVYVEQQYGDESGPARLGLIQTFAGALASLMTGLKAALDFALGVPADWAPPSLVDGPWAAFINWVKMVFTNFYDWVNRTGAYEGLPIPFGEEGLDLVKKFGEALSVLMGGLKGALDLALAVPDDWAPPSMMDGRWAAFINWVKMVFTNFYDWVNRTGAYEGLPIPFGEEGLDLVKKFGEALGVLMGGLKGALDLALAVPEDWAPPSMTDGRWAAFINWVKMVFTNFYDWINRKGAYEGLPIPFGSDGLDLVKKFGEALGALMSGLKGALDLALGAPAGWTPPSFANGPWAAFVQWVRILFQNFYDWINRQGAWQGLPIPFGNDGLDLVKKFGEALGVLMSGLKGALDLALAVPANWTPPSFASGPWVEFVQWVRILFQNFYDWINRQGAWQGIPAPFGADGLELVRKFGEALGALMGGLKAALDLALGLPANWTAPGQYWNDFVSWVQGVFSAFLTYVQRNFPADSEAAKQVPMVKAFGEAMGAVFGGLKSAMDVFQGLAGYIPILRSRFSDFLGNVTFAFNEVKTYATGAGVQAGLAATTAFAQAASAVFQALGAALQVFGQLIEGTNAPVEVFKTRLQSLIQRISITLTAWKTYIQSEAAGNWTPASNTFVNVLNSVLETLRRGLDLFVALNQSGMPSPNQITAFVNSILALFAQLTAGMRNVPGQLDQAGGGINTELRSWPAEWQPLLNGYGGFGQSLAHSLAYGFKQQLENGKVGWAGGNASAAVGALIAVIRTAQEAAYRDVLGFNLGARVADGMIAAWNNAVIRANIGAAIAFNLTTGTGLATYILTTFGGGWVTAGYWLGSNIAYGISDGLRNMAAMIKITDSVTVVIDAIKNAIKVAFNIRSPSRVTAGYGEQIASGLAVGMLAGLGQVTSAGDALAAAVGPYLGTPIGGADYRLQTERRIVVAFEGAAGGGAPMSARQFDELKLALAYAIRTGA